MRRAESCDRNLVLEYEDKIYPGAIIASLSIPCLWRHRFASTNVTISTRLSAGSHFIDSRILFDSGAHRVNT